MARSHLRTAAIAAALLVTAPAFASPNVFWTFGFDPEYGHGAGGRADAGAVGQQAEMAPQPAVSPPAEMAFAAAGRPMLEPLERAVRYASLDDAILAPHHALQ